MTYLQHGPSAADVRLPELTADVKELQTEEAAQVNGGIIAVLRGTVQPPEPDVTRSLTVVGGSSIQP